MWWGVWCVLVCLFGFRFSYRRPLAIFQSGSVHTWKPFSLSLTGLFARALVRGASLRFVMKRERAPAAAGGGADGSSGAGGGGCVSFDFSASRVRLRAALDALQVADPASRAAAWPLRDRPRLVGRLEEACVVDDV